MTTEKSLEDLTFRDIQAICKEKKLLASGKKAELVKRIIESRGKLDEKNVSQEAGLVTNEHAKVQITEQKAETYEMKELDEASKRRLRHERFGITASTMNMTTSGQSVSESQKLSVRAARFGILTSDRGF